MINNLREYQESLSMLREQLDELAVFRARSQEIKSLDDIEGIKCFYDSYLRIGNMIESLFDDVDFRSAYRIIEHE